MTFKVQRLTNTVSNKYSIGRLLCIDFKVQHLTNTVLSFELSNVQYIFQYFGGITLPMYNNGDRELLVIPLTIQ